VLLVPQFNAQKLRFSYTNFGSTRYNFQYNTSYPTDQFSLNSAQWLYRWKSQC